MRCRIRARQCISATVDHNYEPRGVKTYAIFGSDRPCQRTFCDPRLSADPVFDRRDPLPAFADLLGLYGRGDRAAWALGGRRDGHCAALPLPSVGHLWIRSGAKILAERCAVVASVDLRPARPRGKGRGIARRGAVRHRQIPSCKTGDALVPKLGISPHAFGAQRNLNDRGAFPRSERRAGLRPADALQILRGRFHYEAD
jgi:hypothetical protein